MEWKKAVIKVLEDSPEPRHYADIAKEIASKGYRKSNELGATPASSVAVTIGSSLKEDGDASPFERSTRGFYKLRQAATAIAPAEETDDATVSPAAGIINALGMFWDRSKVVWKIEPRVLGRQQQGAEAVDFSRQVGIYFLHDNQGVVYVGRTTDQTLGKRLQQHTVDRLNGRWDRFSWFGIYPVESTGQLRTTIDLSTVGLDTMIATLEAVLIEGLEPRQNRRRGDDFQAVEFLQAEDPAFDRARRKSVLAELANRIDD